ncbi:hypothetical protein ACHAPJ_012083 [Fusarium lateritium]
MTRKAMESAINRLQNQHLGPGANKKKEVLSRAYHEAMERIMSQKAGIRNLAERTLLWITCAKRPLTISELQHALAVELETDAIDDQNFPAVEDMVSACAGLVTIDEESRIIRLVHYTMQEYFAQHQEQWFCQAEETVTSVRVTYLLFGAFDSGPCTGLHDMKQRLQHNPLYDYAARNWGHHARASSSSSELRKLLWTFLSSGKRLMASNQARLASKVPGGGVEHPTMTPSHIVAFFGLSDLIIPIGKRHGMCTKSSEGQTPMSLAAENGHDVVVKMLLEQNRVDKNARAFRYLWTPLSLAASNGHFAVCKLLLDDNEVEPDPRDSGGRTPLSWAAGNGHVDVVELLLADSRVALDSKATWFYKGRTPVMWAAVNGRIAVVELFLKTGRVEHDSNDDDGRTLLSYMAQYGSSELVKQIMAKEDVMHDQKDHLGRTALSWAAQNGRVAVTEQLLARDDVDSHSKDRDIRTPLSWAAQSGHEAVVRTLLATNTINLNIKDNNGHTPLSRAVRCGHNTMVELLLNTTGVISNLKDRNGLSLSALAARNGHNELAKLLPEVESISMSSLLPIAKFHRVGRSHPTTHTAQISSEQSPSLGSQSDIYSLDNYTVMRPMGMGSIRVHLACESCSDIWLCHHAIYCTLHTLKLAMPSSSTRNEPCNRNCPKSGLSEILMDYLRQDEDYLHLLHYASRLVLQDKLFLAPMKLDSPDLRVLDFGTGIGEWAIEFADENPQATVVGMDSSPIQPEWIPRNLQFEPEGYDYIHCCYLAGSIADWPALIDQLYYHLRPGGWIELQDISIRLYSEDDTLEPDNPLVRLMDSLKDVHDKIGCMLDAAPQFEGWVREAGFECIKDQRFRFPVGTWPKDSNLKKIGACLRNNFTCGIDAFTVKPLVDHLGWSQEEVEVLTAEVRKAAKSSDVHAMFDFIVVTAQKPEE